MMRVKKSRKKLDDWCYRCSKYQMKFENPIFSLSGSLYKEELELFYEIKKFLPINYVFEYKHVIGSNGDEFLFLSMANHYIGSKNDVLGLKQITLNLEQYIRNVIEVTPMTNNAQNLTNLYENASCFVYPSLKSNSALMVKFIKNNEKLIMATAHPVYRNIGFLYTGKIYRVYVWENGIEAQIGFTMENGRNLEFFDDNFLNKRASYAPNIPFKARIYAVAFWAKYSKNEDIEVEITPYNVRNFGGKIGDKKVFKTGYMRMCVCADGVGGDKDEFL